MSPSLEAWIAPRFTTELTYSEITRGVLRDPVLRSVTAAVAGGAARGVDGSHHSIT
jgi:hypothetical protein